MPRRTSAARPTLTTRAFASAAEWEAWLAAHHATSPGLWIRLTKKGIKKGAAGRGAAGGVHIEYAEILDLALCHGWIDGQRKSNDERTFLQKFTPRARRSLWSKINRERATLLAKAGRMRPAGLAEIERAKADGRWDAAYDSHATAEVPPELAAALRRSPSARRIFDTLDSRNRYAMIVRIQTAKRAETKARRAADYVAMLLRGERLHP